MANRIPESKVLEMARYIVATEATCEATAQKFGVSKDAVVKRINELILSVLEDRATGLSLDPANQRTLLRVELLWQSRGGDKKGLESITRKKLAELGDV
jgi:hypothetical protein